MPSMSERYVGCFAPRVASEEELFKEFSTLQASVRDIQMDWMAGGLSRGIHYTIQPRTVDEIRDASRALHYPCNFPLAYIKFRNQQAFDAVD
jgi:hypothetical protein